jgi:hypothetical protein
LYLALPEEDRNGFSFLEKDAFASEKKSYHVPAAPPFLILGDDVVIFCDKLAERYKDALAKLEVPISLDKSLTSNIIAEFAGHLITFNTVYKPTKWRQVSHQSFLSFLKVWGIEAIPLLPRHLRQVAYVLASLPEPVGLGFNPMGIPMLHRIAPYIELYSNTPDVPFIEPYLGIGNPKSVLAMFCKLEGVGVLLDTPVFDPSVFIADLKADRADLLSVVKALDPQLARRLALLMPFLQFLTGSDIRAYLNKLYSYSLTSVRLGKILHTLGMYIPGPKASFKSSATTFFKRVEALILAETNSGKS